MLTTPTLMLDEQKCRQNIKAMCLKAEANQVELRPHFKTHQSLEIGRWFKAEGVSKITVSSLTMADYFAPEWQDITVAFPINLLEIETINRLASEIRLNLLLESPQSADFLAQHLNHEIGFFIKIDVGYHRTGVDFNDTHTIDEILRVAADTSNMKFKGFLTHAGHTYLCSGPEEVLQIHSESLSRMAALKQRYLDQYPQLIVSTGDTPSCSIAEDFDGTDEIRPGNFVFYDLMQYHLGACRPDQIAVVMACPIVAIHYGRHEIIVYGGGVHFSKEQLNISGHRPLFGSVVAPKKNAWGEIIPGMDLISLSQEHGIVSVPDALMNDFQIGDQLFILPVHSCMTADAMKRYTAFEDGRIIDHM